MEIRGVETPVVPAGPCARSTLLLEVWFPEPLLFSPKLVLVEELLFATNCPDHYDVIQIPDISQLTPGVRVALSKVTTPQPWALAHLTHI